MTLPPAQTISDPKPSEVVANSSKQWLTALSVSAVYYAGVALLAIPDLNNLLLWILGGVLASFFPLADRVVYVFILRPHEQLSQHIQHLLKQGKVLHAWKLLQHRNIEQQQLLGHSVLFMLAWLGVTFFLLTTNTSWFVAGLVMGIGLQPLLLIAQNIRKVWLLQSKMFWQIQRKLSDREILVLSGIYGMFFFLYTWFLL